MEISTEIKQYVRKLRLSGILDTLPERISYAKKMDLSHLELLELIFQDEVDRRQSTALIKKVKAANLKGDQTLERFDWDAKIIVDKQKIKDVFSLGFADRKEGVIFCGPVGVGKSHLANALGHAACRRGFSVLSIRADKLFKKLLQSRADYSFDRVLRKFISVDVLILDDFGLKALTDQQSADFYELIIERYTRGSFIITSNRDVTEWSNLFSDPILANSALDRLAHNSYQITIEGDSYRRRKCPR